MAIKYLDDLDLSNKTVIIRVDYNVPYDNGMNITDDTRIKATLPTLQYCLDKGAAIVLISHLGRPGGKVVPEMSLKPVSQRLNELIDADVQFTDSLSGEDLTALSSKLKPGQILLLENIRFYPGEKKNDSDLGKLLASLGDIYVDDAFATAHRAHASNNAITKFITTSAAGFLLKKEIESFHRVLEQPERPLTAIIGGAKVSTKLDAIMNILDLVDSLLVGGGMAFTFLKAMGHATGKSLLEEEMIPTAKEIIETAARKKKSLLLPDDVVIAPEFKNEAPTSIVPVDSIPDNMMGLDIGPKTISKFSKVIHDSSTVLINGPMGVFEMPSFAKGTNEILAAIVNTGCFSIAGGGDTVSALNNAGLSEKVSYISTGGGAFLTLLEGKTLPGIEVLEA